MKTNKTTVINTDIIGTITEDNRLVLSIPLGDPTLTKNGRNYVVAQTGSWPSNWVTIKVADVEVGLTVCALVKNPEHPDNKPAPVVVVPPAPKFFANKPAAPAAKPSTNGKPSRLMPNLG